MSVLLEALKKAAKERQLTESGGADATHAVSATGGAKAAVSETDAPTIVSAAATNNAPSLEGDATENLGAPLGLPAATQEITATPSVDADEAALLSLDTPPSSVLADLDMELSEALMDQGADAMSETSNDADLSLPDAPDHISNQGTDSLHEDALDNDLGLELETGLLESDLSDTDAMPALPGVDPTVHLADVADSAVSSDVPEGDEEASFEETYLQAYAEKMGGEGQAALGSMHENAVGDAVDEIAAALEHETSDIGAFDEEGTDDFVDEAVEALPEQHESEAPAVTAEPAKPPDPIAEVVENSELVQRVLGSELNAPQAQSGRSGKSKNKNAKPPHETLSQEAALTALMQSNGRRERGPLLVAGIVSILLVLGGSVYYLLKPSLEPNPFQYRQALVPNDSAPNEDGGESAGSIRSDALMAGLPVNEELDAEGVAEAVVQEQENVQMEDTITLGETSAERSAVESDINEVTQTANNETTGTISSDETEAPIASVRENGIAANTGLTQASKPQLLNAATAPITESVPAAQETLPTAQTQVAVLSPNNNGRLQIEPYLPGSQPHAVFRSQAEHLESAPTEPPTDTTQDNQPYWSDAPAGMSARQQYEAAQYQAQMQVRGGYIDFHSGYYQAAERHYRRALDLDPDNKDAHLGLAGLAQISGDLPEALFRFNHVLQDWPNDEIARAGLTSLHQGQNGVALETELKLLLEKHPDSPHLAFVLGNVYAQRSTWQAAQKYYFMAWSGDSDNMNYLYNLAISLDHLGEQAAAIQFYEKLLAGKPSKSTLFSTQAVQQRLSHLRAGSQKGGS